MKLSIKPALTMIVAALLAAACSSASGQTTTPTGPNKCERPEVSAVVDADTLAVSLVWEVRPEVESLAISPAPASPVTASAGSVAVDVPVGGEGSWHVRAKCLIDGDPWQSSHAVVSLAARDWIAALAERPTGLPEPGGLCTVPGGLDATRERIVDHPDAVAGRKRTQRVNVLSVECPGWARPVEVELSAAPHAVCYSLESALPSDTHLVWAPAWAAWADAHRTAVEWCWYHSIMMFLSNLTGDEEVMAQGLQTKDELEAYMMPIIAQRRADPGDDLLSTLCTAVIDGEQMTDLEIKAFVSLLLVAGGETTDKAMANMMMNLIANPDQLEAVRNDRSLIDNAFAETLRHSPPVQMIMRQPEVDVEMHGVTIPAGSTVTCLIAGANRDPRRYDDPDQFDIFREDLDVSKAFSGAANHTGFCLGRHFCIGAMLAKTEVDIATNQLLDAMDNVAFDGLPPTPEGVFTRAPKTMPLTFTPTGK